MSAREATGGGVSLLEQVTPLARQINCLDIQRIATICVKKIPKLLGARLASLYVLDETNDMLHLQKCNHPYLINKIVSLNQNPPTVMVMAAKSRKLIHISNIDAHAEPVIKKSQRPYDEQLWDAKLHYCPSFVPGQGGGGAEPIGQRRRRGLYPRGYGISRVAGAA